MFFFCSGGKHRKHRRKIFVFSFFVLFLPMPALVARRLHDLNRSGWWAMPIALLFICTYMISVLSVLTIIFSLIISFLAFLILMVAKAFICGLFKNGACDFSGHEFWDIFPLGVMPVGGTWVLMFLCWGVFLGLIAVFCRGGTNGHNRYRQAPSTAFPKNK
ncbi:DUF805 domain-containing protein [uncultured Bartonella sp.]|uniref:DUF805 domain-containing protein n=1 Tax=uncultured Bartonella sp. TaxID=104108 RepID=UPI0034465F48